jgi:CheY-like chemotaxis protein
VTDTILIVEDEPDFAALLELWIGRAGYETVLAANGPDALRRFYEHHPALMILDVSLPGLDGWQIVERSSSSRRAVPRLTRSVASSLAPTTTSPNR